MEISGRVRNIIKKSKVELIDILEKYSWDVTLSKLIMLLSLVYFPGSQVKFEPIEEEIPSDQGFFPIVEIYLNGNIVVYVNKILVKYVTMYPKKRKYWNSWNDIENNRFYTELAEAIQKGEIYRANLKRVGDIIPFLDSSMTVQQHLDWGVEDYIYDGTPEMENLFDVFLGKDSPITKLFKDGVKKLKKKAD
jgi:hypothetical protein